MAASTATELYPRPRIVTAPLRIQRYVARVEKMVRDRFNLAGQVYVQHRVAEYRSMWEAVARNIGASFTILEDDVWQLELGGRRMRIFKHIVEMDDPVTLEVAARKALVYRLLREDGLRVPDHVVFQVNRLDRASAFLQKYSLGCVVKPASGTGAGLGVTTHVQSIKQLQKAAILASLYCADILIEPMVFGECYRLLVFRGQMIHAVKRRGLRVAGTGADSIQTLIDKASVSRRVSGGPPVARDRDCVFTLASQGLSLTSVPRANEHVLVRCTGEGSGSSVEFRTVYTEAVTSQVGDALRADAEKAARVIGSEFVGVD
jgi:hypothetical protein